MSVTPPTYHLTSDFRKRFEAFDGQTVTDALAYFADELAGVDKFYGKALTDHSQRDDHDLRRTPVEQYAADLIAIRDLDRRHRTAFNAARNTLIVLPDCLSIHDTPCQKVDHKRGDICRRCLPECQAKQVTDLAARYRTRVVFSKRKLEKQLEYYKRATGDLGVIGVACILMLAEGMRTAEQAGVPARGVPLMYCGCEHWNDVTFTSVFSLPWLESLLEEKYGRRD